LGIFIQPEYLGHSGFIAGFRAVLNYSPEFDTVVVMLYNNDIADPEQSLSNVMSPVFSLLSVEN